MTTQDRGIFTDGLAELCKPRAGKPYRPSNGEEGSYFERAYCSHCKHETKQNPCSIWTVAHFADVDDDDYPKELQYGTDGQPTCTAFDPKEPEKSHV